MFRNDDSDLTVLPRRVGIPHFIYLWFTYLLVGASLLGLQFGGVLLEKKMFSTCQGCAFKKKNYVSVDLRFFG